MTSLVGSVAPAVASPPFAPVIGSRIRRLERNFVLA